MNKKIVIGSIFAVLLMLTMPMISNIQAETLYESQTNNKNKEKIIENQDDCNRYFFNYAIVYGECTWYYTYPGGGFLRDLNGEAVDVKVIGFTSQFSDKKPSRFVRIHLDEGDTFHTFDFYYMKWRPRTSKPVTEPTFLLLTSTELFVRQY